MNKRELLDQIEQEQLRWTALLAEVGEEHMLQPGAMGDWTFKDVIAHLNAWQQHSITLLEAAQRKQAPVPPPWPSNLDWDKDQDQINQWVYMANWDRPLADLLQESRHQFEQLTGLIQMLPEADLFDPQHFPWTKERSLASTTFGHFDDEHEPALRTWLEQTLEQA